MKLKTEVYYVLFLATTLSVLGIVFVQLLRKYTFANLFTLENVCSVNSIHLDYTSFNTIGKTIGMMFTILAILLCLKIVISVYKTHRKTTLFNFQQSTQRFSKLQKICNNRNIPLHKVIVIDTTLHIALTVGIRNSKIIVSSGLIRTLSLSQLEAVLLHEVHHLHRLHPVLFFIGEIVSSSFSFFPIVKDIIDQFKMKLEHEADTFACSLQGTHQYIQHALQTVHINTSSEAIYPSFSQQAYHKRIADLQQAPRFFEFKKGNTISSITLLCILILFIYAPITVKAQIGGEQTSFVDCSEISHSSCETYCQPQFFTLFSKEKHQSQEQVSSRALPLASFTY